MSQPLPRLVLSGDAVDVRSTISEWIGRPGMEEWTDDFITAAQHELTAMVKDWQYDYGASDEDCVAMLLWKVLRLKPDLKLDLDALKRSQQLSDQA